MIIVLDGLPGAGKTTLVKRLVDECDFLEVPEMLVEYKDPEDGFITFDFETYFLKYDVLKCQKALELSKKSKNIVMDKNYLSTIAFNYAVTECKKGDSYDKVRSWFASHQEALIKPDCYFFLSIPVELSFARKQRKVGGTDFWGSEELLERMKDFFETKANSFDTDVPKYTIDTEGSQDQVLEKIRTILAGIDKKT